MEIIGIIGISVGSFVIALFIVKCYRDQKIKNRTNNFQKKLVKFYIKKNKIFNDKFIQIDEQNNNNNETEKNIKEEIRNTECVYV